MTAPTPSPSSPLDSNPEVEARMLVAQAWCTKANAHKVMDPELANAVAEIFAPYIKKLRVQGADPGQPAGARERIKELEDWQNTANSLLTRMYNIVEDAAPWVVWGDLEMALKMLEKSHLDPDPIPAAPAAGQVDPNFASVDSAWLVSRCTDALEADSDDGRAQALEIIRSQAKASIAGFRTPTAPLDLEDYAKGVASREKYLASAGRERGEEGAGGREALKYLQSIFGDRSDKDPVIIEFLATEFSPNESFTKWAAQKALVALLGEAPPKAEPDPDCYCKGNPLIFCLKCRPQATPGATVQPQATNEKESENG